MEAVALPELQDAILDDATLGALFTDLQHTQLLGIVYKVSPLAADAAELPRDLAHARAALQSGQLLGVQIRYRHEGREWWDTLMCTPSGTRLLRIEQSGR